MKLLVEVKGRRMSSKWARREMDLPTCPRVGEHLQVLGETTLYEVTAIVWRETLDVPLVIVDSTIVRTVECLLE